MKCPACGGSKMHWHRAPSLEHPSFSDRYWATTDDCPHCNGTGVVPAGVAPEEQT